MCHELGFSMPAKRTLQGFLALFNSQYPRQQNERAMPIAVLAILHVVQETLMTTCLSNSIDRDRIA